MDEPINFNSRKSVYDKLHKYIFNPDDEDGWPKGRWFMLALGFNPDNREHVKLLARQVRFDGSRAIFQRRTEYGEVYRVLLSITGPNKRPLTALEQFDKKILAAILFAF